MAVYGFGNNLSGYVSPSALKDENFGLGKSLIKYGIASNGKYVDNIYSRHPDLLADIATSARIIEIIPKTKEISFSINDDLYNLFVDVRENKTLSGTNLVLMKKNDEKTSYIIDKSTDLIIRKKIRSIESLNKSLEHLSTSGIVDHYRYVDLDNMRNHLESIRSNITADSLLSKDFDDANSLSGGGLTNLLNNKIDLKFDESDYIDIKIDDDFFSIENGDFKVANLFNQQERSALKNFFDINNVKVNGSRTVNYSMVGFNADGDGIIINSDTIPELNAGHLYKNFFTQNNAFKEISGIPSKISSDELNFDEKKLMVAGFYGEDTPEYNTIMNLESTSRESIPLLFSYTSEAKNRIVSNILKQEHGLNGLKFDLTSDSKHLITNKYPSSISMDIKKGSGDYVLAKFAHIVELTNKTANIDDGLAPKHYHLPVAYAVMNKEHNIKDIINGASIGNYRRTQGALFDTLSSLDFHANSNRPNSIEKIRNSTQINKRYSLAAVLSQLGNSPKEKSGLLYKRISVLYNGLSDALETNNMEAVKEVWKDKKNDDFRNFIRAGKTIGGRGLNKYLNELDGVEYLNNKDVASFIRKARKDPEKFYSKEAPKSIKDVVDMFHQENEKINTFRAIAPKELKLGLNNLSHLYKASQNMSAITPSGITHFFNTSNVLGMSDIVDKKELIGKFKDRSEVRFPVLNIRKAEKDNSGLPPSLKNGTPEVNDDIKKAEKVVESEPKETREQSREIKVVSSDKSDILMSLFDEVDKKRDKEDIAKLQDDVNKIDNSSSKIILRREEEPDGGIKP